jgi:hypothetical protein
MKHWFNIIECNKSYFIYKNIDILPDLIKLPNNSNIISIGLNSNTIQILLKYNPYMLCLIDSNKENQKNKNSNVLESFVDNYLDLIFINVNNSFDLKMAYKKIKNNGWIITYSDCNDIQKTISKFCFEYLLKINFMFNDGFVSYAIQITKLK